eukprot:jgi/Tetstr1/422560/TSEL_013368.t1
MRNEYLRCLVGEYAPASGPAAVRAMSEVASMYLQGRLPGWFNRLFASARLVAPVKKLGEGRAPDVRPVAVGEAERRAAERAVVDNMKEAYVSVLAPSQLGVGIPAGDSVLIHGVRLIAEKLGPRAVIVHTDLRNAYNEAWRRTIIQRHIDPDLRMRNEYLRCLVGEYAPASGPAAVRAMSEVASMYLQGRLPGWFNRLFASARLVAPVKKLGEGRAPDVRPVAVGEAERRAAERAVVDNMKEAYVSVLAPSQLGVGIPAGDSVLIHGVRLIAEKLGPRAVIVHTDLRNAYNEAWRRTIIQRHIDPDLRMRNEYLRCLVGEYAPASGPAAVRAMSEVASMYLQGRLPGWFNRLFASARLVAPVKKLGEGRAPDVRPVAVGEAERRAAERAVVDNMKEAYVSVLAPSQLGVGIPAGDSVLIHGVRLIAEKLGPRAVIVHTDLRNAYNEAWRRTIIQRHIDCSPLHPVIPALLASLSTDSYLVVDDRSAPLRSEDGVQQGAPLATTSFCVAIHPEVQQCDTTLEVNDGAARFNADDGILVGLPEHVWPALHAFRTSIKASVGLEVRFDKMQANNSRLRNEVCALPATCRERILFNQLDAASGMWTVAIPTARTAMTPHELREVAAGYFFLPSPCLAPVVGCQIILPSTEHNPVIVDLYGDALMNLPAPGDAHWRVQHDAIADAFRDHCVHDLGIAVRREVDDLFQQAVPLGNTVPRDELKDLVPDAELSLPAFNVVTGSYDPRSLKSTLLEFKTMRYGVKYTSVPRATAVDRFERSLLGDIQRGLAARDAAWHNTEPGHKGPLRDILDMSEYTGMVFGTVACQQTAGTSRLRNNCAVQLPQITGEEARREAW